MKLAMVSTYPPTRCGIAEYTRNLINNLPMKDVILITDSNAWRKGSIFGSILGILRASRDTEIVHFQHEWLLYGHPYCNIVPLMSIFILRRMKRLPVITTFHSVISLKKINLDFLSDFNFQSIPIGIVKIAVKFLTSWMASLSTRIIVHTENAKKVLCEEYGVAITKVNVIPLGVPKSIVYDQEEPFLELTRGQISTKILFYGFVDKSKGMDTLLKALVKVKASHSVVLLISGQVKPNYLPELEHMIKEFGLSSHVKFNNTYLPIEKIHSYIECADILVLPYTKGSGCYYSSSAVLADIMSHEKTVIISDIPQLADTIENNITGLIFPMKDNAELAEAIIQMIENPTKRSELGHKLKALGESRLWPKVSSMTNELYKEVLNIESQSH